jgi:hypothetical protein
MTDQPANPAELERQRATIEAQFRDGWIPRTLPDGRQRKLTAAAYAQARKVLSSGGRTGLDQETIQAVREGARPGDPLPPRQRRPFIRGVSDDAEVIITGAGPGGWVALLFSHEDFPGTRFGHRFSQHADKHGLIWLMEEIETGALHRMMRQPPPADAAGITWTTWDDSAAA